MVDITNEIYNRLSKELLGEIGESNFHNATIEVQHEEISVRLSATLIIYRDTSVEIDGHHETIGDIVPVWWECHTVSEEGEQDNNFSWSELREFLIQ